MGKKGEISTDTIVYWIIGIAVVFIVAMVLFGSGLITFFKNLPNGGSPNPDVDPDPVIKLVDCISGKGRAVAYIINGNFISINGVNTGLYINAAAVYYSRGIEQGGTFISTRVEDSQVGMIGADKKIEIINQNVLTTGDPPILNTEEYAKVSPYLIKINGAYFVSNYICNQNIQ